MTCLSLAVLSLGLLEPAVAHPVSADQGEVDLGKQVQGLVAGKPTDCVSLSQVDGQTIIDGTAILYRGLGGKLWINRPRGAELLRDDDILVQFVYGSQLCKLDRIKLIDRGSGIDHGTIGLGEFIPYRKPAG